MNRQQRRKEEKNKSAQLAFKRKLIDAINIHQNKHYDQARNAYEELYRINPNDYDLVRHIGILHQDMEEYEEAYNKFLYAIKINPNGFEAINNLGTIHVLNKNDTLALKCFEKSNAIKPDYIPTINNLAGIYHRLQNAELALKYAKNAFSLQKNNIFTINQYAKALIINNRIDEGINLLEELCKNNPERLDFKANLATAFKEIGDFKKSKKIIDEVFPQNFKRLDFFAPFASDKENTLSTDQLEYYENQLDNESLHIDDKVLISHALFEYFRNKKNYLKSGEFLNLSNALQYSRKEFEIEKDIKFFDLLKTIFSSQLSFEVSKPSKVKPIFICGMPRSGTTLCEQILSSHSKVKGGGELSDLSRFLGFNHIIQPDKQSLKEFNKNIQDKSFLNKVRKNYIDKILSLNDKKAEYVTDKLPHNFILIGIIKLILPEAKIIYCKRDPIDNCFSLYTHKFVENSHQYSYDQKKLAEYYHLHSDLMNFWLEEFNDGIYVLDNEELVKNQELVSKSLVAFCDLKWEEQCLDFHKTRRQVRTASIHQVRQPMNNKSIGAWKNYDQFLGNLITTLKAK